MSKLINIVGAISLLGVLSCHGSDQLNEIPMYGERPKPPDLVQADERFVEETIRVAGSREKASDLALQVAWQAMSARDWRLAMKRFNEAWLLTPDNANVFWGFGAACGLKGDYEAAVRHFSKAIGLDATKPRIFADFAFTYILLATKPFQSQQARAAYLDKAINLLQTADRLHPDSDIVYFNWAQALFYKGDYAGAWSKIFEAEKRGGQSIDPSFLKDLASKMARPNAALRDDHTPPGPA